jgi:hypothetical protein
MNLDAEVDWLLKNFPKRDIATALARRRERDKRNSSSVLTMERQLFEIKESLELLPENATHQDVLNRIRSLSSEGAPGAEEADAGPT